MTTIDYDSQLVKAIVISFINIYGRDSSNAPYNTIDEWVNLMYSNNDIDPNEYSLHNIQTYLVSEVSSEIDECMYTILPDNASEILEETMLDSFNDMVSTFDDIINIGFNPDFQLPTYFTE